MLHRRVVSVAVDAMGGDRAPDEILAGVELALAADPELRAVLTGDAEVVQPFVDRHEHASAHPTTSTIGMDEHPASAVRSKKDSSIVAGCRLVREASAEAFVSAGNTGACMAAATLVMGRIEGISRPAIATVIPAGHPPVVLLDVGANAECRPEHLVHFAHMGSAYAKTVLGVSDPRIALLNIGEEPAKGSALTVEAHHLIANEIAGFAGNIEGRDVLTGDVDVIVTDGFTGNVVLKLLEGTCAAVLGQIKETMTATLPRRLASSVLAPSMRAMKARLDPDTYGGAPLLGVDGVCIICHGSSGRAAISAALAVAARAAREGLTSHIAGAVGHRQA